MLRSLLFTTALVGVVATAAFAHESGKAVNAYTQTNFVANKASYKPQKVEKAFINGWGIAIRPVGAGGHFWVAGHDVSYEYVGDVHNSSDAKLQTLHTDKLEYVKVPTGGDDNFTTGIVYSDSKDKFVITQTIPGVEPVTAPAKFLFASDGGIISAWTERKKEDGTFDRSGEALKVIDESAQGAQFFGLAINSNYDRIYAANFGVNPDIKVYDGTFKPVSVTFDAPFDDNKNGKVDPGEYAPFNIQALKTPAGQNHIFVTYAKTQACPAEEVAKKTCEAGALFVGEEDTSVAGNGRLAEFSEDGKLVSVWNDGSKLSAPWGVAYAPEQFGALSGALLVANFGDGTIAGFDATTHTFKSYLNDAKGKTAKIDKIWGILFGNGESLGDKNALYFTAGPEDEADGLFGSLRPVAAE